MRILTVDDDPTILSSLQEALLALGHEPVACNNADEAVAQCQQEIFPLVITDIRMPGMDGLQLLEHFKQDPHMCDSDVVMITGHGDLQTSIQALRKGAYDYLTKPMDINELLAVVERSAEHQALLRENRTLTHHMEERVNEATESIRDEMHQMRKRLGELGGAGVLIAESPAMRTVMEEALLYHADPTVPVLIEGETGTGKEVIARLIHHGAGSVEKPFIDVNCSAISAELFESELFGYEPGAFTGGSEKGAIGKMEAAGDGTLLLDEIGDMPLSLQPKLLRALQDRAFYRVGGVKKRLFNARIVCSTNQQLSTMLENGNFRRDLFHRLAVGHIRLPALRDRREDIPALAAFFLRRYATQKRKRFTSIHPDALAFLQDAPWPGNIRELENAIERAILMNDSDELRIEHLQSQVLANSQLGKQATSHATQSPLSLNTVTLPEGSFDLDAFCNTIILRTLEKFDGNKTKAAEYLHMSRHAIRRRLDQIE